MSDRRTPCSTQGPGWNRIEPGVPQRNKLALKQRRGTGPQHKVRQDTSVHIIKSGSSRQSRPNDLVTFFLSVILVQGDEGDLSNVHIISTVNAKTTGG